MVGCQLQMSGEIYHWLADLRDSDPPAAVQVGQALTALAGENGGLRPPLVVSLAAPAGPVDRPEALDRAYQEQLKSLQILRRHVAEVARLRQEIDQEITDLQSLLATPEGQRRRPPDNDSAAETVPTETERAAAGDLIAELRRLLPGVIKAEQQLTGMSCRQHAQGDAFRTRKETLKAIYNAARAGQFVEQASGKDLGTTGAEHEDPGPPVTGATARLQKVTDQIEQELRHQAPAQALMELRPGAPGNSDIRILFASEPPGTALLIAVLEGRDAVRDHYPEAVALSARVLQRVRVGQAPEATAHTFGDPHSFLDEFFPGSAEEIQLGATALAARNRARTLAEQRTQLGLTQTQVAQRMGVRQERVSAIERAEPGATEVRTLASYVEALGGRLDITADFGEERVLLR